MRLGFPDPDLGDRGDRDDHLDGLLLGGMGLQRDEPEPRTRGDRDQLEERAVAELDRDRDLLAQARDLTMEVANEFLGRTLDAGSPDRRAQKSLSSAAAPTWSRPSSVMIRPRGVRWMNPSWSRYGS